MFSGSRLPESRVIIATSLAISPLEEGAGAGRLLRGRQAGELQSPGGEGRKKGRGERETGQQGNPPNPLTAQEEAWTHPKGPSGKQDRRRLGGEDPPSPCLLRSKKTPEPGTPGCGSLSSSQPVYSSLKPLCSWDTVSHHPDVPNPLPSEPSFWSYSLSLSCLG